MTDQRTVHLTQETLTALTAQSDGDLEAVLQTLCGTTDNTMSETTDDTPSYDAYITTLEGIDTLAYNLLAAIDDDQALDETAKRQAKRRLREVRAEIDPLLLAFRHHAPKTTDSAHMQTDRGPGSVSHRGPDPATVETETRTDNSEDDDE